jgi:hypothetical protein
MEIYWSIIMIMIGLWMVISSITKSRFIVYKLIYARAKIVWKDKTHIFILVSGVIISALGILFLN